MVWAQPTVNPQSNLSFGKIIGSGLAGTVTLTPTFVRTAIGGVTLHGGTVVPMNFIIQGTPGDAFTLTGFPASLPLVGPGGGLVASTWVSDLPGGGFSGIFGAGPTTVHVGASLAVPASPVPGSYSGSFSFILQDTTSSQNSFPATMDILYTIVEQPLGYTVLQQMDFGSLVVSGAGTCTLAPNGVRSASANIGLAGAGSVTAGSVQITGQPGDFVAVTFGASSISLAGPGAPMTLDTFTKTTVPNGQFNLAGICNLTLGATVHVNAGQAQGLYAGSFNVTMTYN